MFNWLCIIKEPETRINNVLPYEGKLYFCGNFSSKAFIGCLADDNLEWFRLISDDLDLNGLCRYRDYLAVSENFFLGLLDLKSIDFKKCWAVFNHNEIYHAINDICCTNDFVVACNEDGGILKVSVNDLNEVRFLIKSLDEENPIPLLSISHSKGYAVTGREGVLMLLGEDFNVKLCIDFSETKEKIWLNEPCAACLEGNRIYVCGDYYYTICFNSNGEPLWGQMLSTKSNELFLQPTPSIAIDKNYLYLTYGEHILILDKHTGKPISEYKVYIEGTEADISKIRILNNSILVCGGSNIGGFIASFSKENVNRIKSSNQHLQVVSTTPKTTSIHPQVKHLDPIIEELSTPGELVETFLKLERKPVKIMSYGNAPVF